MFLQVKKLRSTNSETPKDRALLVIVLSCPHIGSLSSSTANQRAALGCQNLYYLNFVTCIYLLWMLVPNQCDFLTEFSFTGQIRQLGEATYNTNGRESSVVFTWLLQLRCIGLTPSKGSRPARNYCRLTSKLCKMEKLWSYGKAQIFH